METQGSNEFNVQRLKLSGEGGRRHQLHDSDIIRGAL